MASTLEQLLTSSQRAAYPFIRGFVKAGLGVNEIQRRLQAEGVGIRKQDLGKIVNLVKAGTAVTTMRQNIMYTVHFSGFNTLLDDFDDGYLTVWSATPLTEGQRFDAAMSILDSNSDNYPLEDIEFEDAETIISPTFVS